MKRSLKYTLISIVMIASSATAIILKPTINIADQEDAVNLVTLIPRQFGDWKIDESIMPIIPNPQQQATIEKVYDQTLDRTYYNSRGEYVMLSIAYGGVQSDKLQIHQPEVCYTSQGFTIQNVRDVIAQFADQSLPVRRLVAVRGARNEPITYWITVGDRVALNGLQRKLAQLSYGLKGSVPDGLLFRVSSLSSRPEESFNLHDRFVAELLNEVSTVTKTRLMGSLVS